MPMILSPRYYIIELSNGELREVYRRDTGGRLMIVGVTSPSTSYGFANIREIEEFYMRHFNLKINQIVSE